MALPWSFMSKITNSKHQITNKSQIPISKSQRLNYFNFPSIDENIFFNSFGLLTIIRFGILNFGSACGGLFVCFLGFVIWNLIC